MSETLTIPEWTGNRLTHGAFLNYATHAEAKGKKKDAPESAPETQG